jgi:hypothetical protein
MASITKLNNVLVQQFIIVYVQAEQHVQNFIIVYVEVISHITNVLLTAYHLLKADGIY